MVRPGHTINVLFKTDFSGKHSRDVAGRADVGGGRTDSAHVSASQEAGVWENAKSSLNLSVAAKTKSSYVVGSRPGVKRHTARRV